MSGQQVNNRSGSKQVGFKNSRMQVGFGCYSNRSDSVPVIISRLQIRFGSLQPRVKPGFDSIGFQSGFQVGSAFYIPTYEGFQNPKAAAAAEQGKAQHGGDDDDDGEIRQRRPDSVSPMVTTYQKRGQSRPLLLTTQSEPQNGGGKRRRSRWWHGSICLEPKSSPVANEAMAAEHARNQR
ncbi:hypothetical protein GQ457_07G005980 [Hibiscus cannabinus]